MSNNSVKPLELVVSAIHSLKETRGSTPLNILRYLSGKYNVDTEMLKPYVKTGLKRGVSFGLITQQSGLYRLNEVLSAPMDQSTSKVEKKHSSKSSKTSGILRKGKLRQNSGRKKRRSVKPATSQLQKKKRKTPKRRNKRKTTGPTSRRLAKERPRKQKRQKTGGKKRMWKKCDKPRKAEKHNATLDVSEQQKCEKEGDVTKDTPKM